MKDREREAYEKLVAVLADEVDYLRAQLAFTGRFTAHAPAKAPPLEPTPLSQEDREEIEHLHRRELLDDEEAFEALRQIGVSGDIRFD